VSHAVDTLTNHREALCVGSSEIYVYFKHIHKMYQSGPYSDTHATAGTFAFRASMLKDCCYENHAALAEERHFLKNYTVPFAQLDPLKTILVFSHEHNTFDKRKLLENPHPDFFKESSKTINMFIRQEKEKPIKDFFLKDIDALLEKYDPGKPCMKPDVLEQIKQIEKERLEMAAKAGGGNNQIVINQPGQPPRALSNDEVMNLMNQQLEHIKQLTDRNQMLENIIKTLYETQGKSPAIPEPPKKENPSSDNAGFVDTLLERIADLEREVSSYKTQLEGKSQEGSL